MVHFLLTGSVGIEIVMIMMMIMMIVMIIIKSNSSIFVVIIFITILKCRDHLPGRIKIANSVCNKNRNPAEVGALRIHAEYQQREANLYSSYSERAVHWEEDIKEQEATVEEYVTKVHGDLHHPADGTSEVRSS